VGRNNIKSTGVLIMTIANHAEMLPHMPSNSCFLVGHTSNQEVFMRSEGLHIRNAGPTNGREPVREVERIDAELNVAIDEMLGLMRSAGHVALAGPIVGLPLRVVAVDLSASGMSQIVLINPVVEERSEECQRDREGCLALPELTGHVDRPVWVVVSGLTRTGRAVRLRAGGILGRILQHQIDHLDGLTFVDRVRTKPAA
jgi:peptide deformylase